MRHESYTNKEKIFPHYHNEYYLNTKGNLLPWHEVKAINGIVWKYDEAYLTQNKDICSYVRGGSSMWGSSRTDYAIPTRGNCIKCEANGALGKRCHNMCTEIGIVQWLCNRLTKEEVNVCNITLPTNESDDQDFEHGHSKCLGPNALMLATRKPKLSVTDMAHISGKKFWMKT